jgi:hypothetical protein
MSSREKNNNLQFGLTIPQGWRGGDLPIEEENNPVSCTKGSDRKRGYSYIEGKREQR